MNEERCGESWRWVQLMKGWIGYLLGSCPTCEQHSDHTIRPFRDFFVTSLPCVDSVDRSVPFAFSDQGKEREGLQGAGALNARSSSLGDTAG